MYSRFGLGTDSSDRRRKAVPFSDGENQKGRSGGREKTGGVYELPLKREEGIWAGGSKGGERLFHKGAKKNGSERVRGKDWGTERWVSLAFKFSEGGRKMEKASNRRS